MKQGRRRRILLAALAFAVLVALVLGARWYQRVKQVADPNFNTGVAHPTYARERHPKVLFDEAHHNFHTAGGRYKAFADLLTNDGYRVTPNQEAFRKETFGGFDILVIANAMGAFLPILPGAAEPAFTGPECDAVRDWVREGGALLLISDHEPTGSAARILSQRFGVDMSTGRTFDQTRENREPQSPFWLVFSRDNHLLSNHPITQGRDATERVNYVIAFTGQSLKGPEGSAAFLRLADSAVDILPSGERVSAAGRSVGIALPFGKGRVVILGEAAMLSAQLVGAERLPMGMNYPGNDNRQLALNIMHWLSGVLPWAGQPATATPERSR